MRKVTIIGGGGVRAPLLIHGLAQSQALFGIGEVVLYDIDEARTETIARIGREIVRNLGAGFSIRVSSDLEAAAAGADFVLNLPAASGGGNIVVVKKNDANAHNIAITPSGTDTIDGVNAAVNISLQNDALRLIDSGVGTWVIW